MNPTTPPIDIVELLQTDENAIPWPDRETLAEDLGAQIASRDASQPALELVDVLSRDKKWEVRCAIARLLVHLPELDCRQLAGRLARDESSHVRGAVRKALAGRSKSQQRSSRDAQQGELLQDQFTQFERLYGRAAAQRARKLVQAMAEHQLAATTHELRPAIASLRVDAEALVSHAGEAGLHVAKELGQRIVQNVEFASRLVEDARDYAQSSPLVFRPELLRPLVADAVRAARAALAGRGQQVPGVRVKTRVPADLIVEVARDRLLACLANVLKNAFEAMTPDDDTGSIWVRARAARGKLRLVIKDSGEGMPAATLSSVRAFMPGTTTKPSHGTGFGLPIAEKIVTRHGGELQIESRPRAGTSVTIALPLQQRGKIHEVQGAGH